MKPIFSTEQARYQKFASFFIDVTGISRSAERGYFALCVKVCATRKLSSDQGSAFGNRHLLKKVDENFLALAQLLMFIRCHPWRSRCRLFVRRL